MRTSQIFKSRIAVIAVITALTAFSGINYSSAQNFDFDRIRKKAEEFSAIVTATVSISMGSEPFETQVRGLGVIVTEGGLVMIDASLVDMGSGMAAMFGSGGGFDVLDMKVKTLDGAEYTAEWLGADRFSGIGFCEISDTKGKKFTPVSFTKRDTFRIGEWVGLFYLLPEYVEPPLAADIGLVSALITEPEKAPLVVGFSDMELNSVIFDDRGRAIGILTQLSSQRSQMDSMDPSSFFGQAGGFPMYAILGPDRLQQLISDPPQRGKQNRGWLGVSFQALSKDIADYWGLEVSGGVIINEVVKNSPADSAGFRVGDVLISVNDEPVKVDREESLHVLRRAIAELGPGATANMRVLRRDESGAFSDQMLTAELAEAPITSAEAKTYEDKKFEFKARDLVFADYLALNLDREEFEGVRISEVKSGGWAELGGLQPGDIVQSINGEKISSVAETESVMADITDQKLAEVVFLVFRDHKTLFVNIKPQWGKS